jgi:hypothetical protein
MGVWLYGNRNQNSQLPFSRSEPFFSSFRSRLLKNGHLLRYPYPSSCQARGRLVVTYSSRNGLKPFPTKNFGGPRNRDFAGSTCICLPARSRFGEGRALFEQPG